MKDGTPRHVRRYRLARLSLLSIAFFLGLAIAYAEHQCWLPRQFTVASFQAYTAKVCIGPSFGRSLVVPILMLGALPTAGYYPLSRVCLFASALLCGANSLPFFLTPSPALIVSLTLILLWMHLLMRTDVEAARGIQSRAQGVSRACAIGQYLLRLCLLWGEAILICFLLYFTAGVM
ncbi:MAG: hypothetical protein J6R04_01395 [Clostridia bacterium]|nr:hypothetical protein [Clostridia bacterium]